MKSSMALVALLLLVLPRDRAHSRANGEEAPADSLFTRADLSYYMGKWEINHGKEGQVISDYFCDFVVVEPSTFLEMTETRGIFQQWLSSLDELSFVDWGYDCVDRECLRLHMIDSLRGVRKLKDSRLEGDRLQLLDRLAKIRIRKIG